jgi:hypothetical protein
MERNFRQDASVGSPQYEPIASAAPELRKRPADKRKARGWGRRWLPMLLSVIFGAGLLVQVFGTRLEITNNAFLIPRSLVADGQNIHPAELVADERRRQSLAALLTIGGALGLAIYYRRSLISSLRPQNRGRASFSTPLNSHSRIQQKQQPNRIP